MKYIAIIVTNLFILFVLILLIEYSLPYLTEIKIGKERYLKIDEYQPNSSLKYLFNDDVYKKTIDNNGFSVNNQINSPNNKKSIYFLGSSNVETLYVSEGKRLSDLTTSKLNIAFDEKFNAFNSSKGGLNTSHMLKHLIFKIIPQKPDYVFLMPTNDYSYLLKYQSYHKGPKNHYFTSDFFHLFKIIKDTFIPNLYIFLRSSIEFQIPEVGIDNDLSLNPAVKIDRVDLLEFEKYFNSIIKICKIFDIKLILATQFYNVEAYDNRDDINKVTFMNNKINSIVRELARKENIVCLNLDSLIPKTYDYMYDAGHLNEKGTDLVSDLITQEIINIESQND